MAGSTSPLIRWATPSARQAWNTAWWFSLLASASASASEPRAIARGNSPTAASEIASQYRAVIVAGSTRPDGGARVLQLSHGVGQYLDGPAVVPTEVQRLREIDRRVVLIQAEGAENSHGAVRCLDGGSSVPGCPEPLGGVDGR